MILYEVPKISVIQSDIRNNDFVHLHDVLSIINAFIMKSENIYGDLWVGLW